MKLIFEEGAPGRHLDLLPQPDVPEITLDETWNRKEPPKLPQLSETEISRHYTQLAGRTRGVNGGFYPLGSCTMKYNPKVNEAAAALPGFQNLHPLQPEDTVQGALGVLYEAGLLLNEITAMDQMTFQPAAGAHGEFTGLLLIKAWHQSRGEVHRRKIIVPDSAHGTNPASAAMCGMEVVSIPSAPDGCVDLEALKAAMGPDVAGLMLTNPNTLGLFDRNIEDITRIVHEAGGLCYYDGANLNAVMGIVRPGDMGFDLVHLNLHKTFSTPHGGGGPGCGAVGCKSFLAPFLPGMIAVKNPDGTLAFEKPARSIGSVKAFHGNFLVVVKALAYILTLGREGIPEAARNAVLNANYMRAKLSDVYDMACPGLCMHEFVMDLGKLKHETGVTAMDVAKSLLDYGIHPPTMYFPLIVHEALMAEPTETEDRETLDEAIEVFHKIYRQAYENPQYLKESPHNTPIGRPDEVTAARKPVLCYRWESGES